MNTSTTLAAPPQPLNRAQRRAIQQRKGTYWHHKPEVMQVLNEQYRGLAKFVLNPTVVSRTFDEAELVDLRINIEQSWGLLKRFEGTEGAVALLDQSFRHALVRAESISVTLIADLQAGIDALARMTARASKGHKLGPDAQALLSVPVAMMIYDEILINSSPLQMDQARVEADRRKAEKDGAP